MKKTDAIEDWDVIADLPNVIEKLVETSKDKKETKKVRDLARHIAVYLLCLKADLEYNNII